MSDAISSWFTEISSSAQLWLICRPNFLTRSILNLFYIIDTFLYAADPFSVLKRHSAIMGTNYAALGRIIVGDYEIAADIISNPQKRGNYLGRTKLNEDKLPKNFPLFLSDEEAGGGTLHSIIHENLWTLMQKALDRVNGTEYTSYVKEGVEEWNSGTDKATRDKAISNLVIKYIVQSIFDIVLSQEDIDLWSNIANSPDPTANYLVGAWHPFSGIFHFFQSTRTEYFEKAREMVIDSPALKDYVPSDNNANMTKSEYAEALVSMVSIAGILGGIELLKAIIEIPGNAAINVTDEMEVTYAVLEAARIRPPVLNANAISMSERTLEVNGNLHTIPSDTVFMYSIALASLDPEIYEDPFTFDHMRENLTESVLLFNHVGYYPERVGLRNCPGRNVVIKLGRSFLVEARG